MSLTQNCRLFHLPPDLFRHLLIVIGPECSCILSRTCKELHKICSQEAVWKSLFSSTFGAEAAEWAGKAAPQGENCFWKERFAELSYTNRPFVPLDHWSRKVSKRDAIHAITSANNKTKHQPVRELNLVVLGEGGSGKSALTIRYVSNHFIVEYDPTIEDSYRKQVKLHDQTVLLNILDTAGPEDYPALAEHWIRQSSAALVLLCLTQQNALEYAEVWLRRVVEAKKKPPMLPVLLVGSKCDLKNERRISRAAAIELARKYNVPYLETSAKDKTNVALAFEFAADIGAALKYLEMGSNKVKEKEEKCFVM